MKKINEFLKELIVNKKINLGNNEFNGNHKVKLKPVYVERDERFFDNK